MRGSVPPRHRSQRQAARLLDRSPGSFNGLRWHADESRGWDDRNRSRLSLEPAGAGRSPTPAALGIVRVTARPDGVTMPRVIGDGHRMAAPFRGEAGGAGSRARWQQGPRRRSPRTEPRRCRCGHPFAVAAGRGRSRGCREDFLRRVRRAFGGRPVRLLASGGPRLSSRPPRHLRRVSLARRRTRREGGIQPS